MGQRIKEDKYDGEIYIHMSFKLTTDNEAMSFLRASEEIELMVPDTEVKMINLADYEEGEPPPPTPGNGKNLSEHWELIGVIRGPMAKNMTDAHKAPLETKWAKQIISILESYGLKQKEEILH